MLRKFEKAVLVSSLLLAAITGVAWLHSSLVGYQHAWSDPGNEGCGRLLSTQGRILWQSCTFKSHRSANDPSLTWQVQMPAEFVVGSNPGGERAAIAYGANSVLFAFPAPGLFLGYSGRTEDNANGINRTRWAYQWQEQTISYWFIIVVLLLMPVAGLTEWLLKKRRLANKLPLQEGAK